MSYLTLGQLTIPITWLAFLIAIFYSDFRTKEKDEGTNKVINRFFWLYLLVWKFSYILFSWDSFLQAPMSLLYFDGGFKGHLLATLMGANLLVKYSRVLDWELAWKYWARFVATSHLIYFMFTGQWLLVIAWLLIFLFIEWKWEQWIFLAQWTLLLWVGGWLDPFVVVHGIVILSVIIKRKHYQHMALVIVLSLLAMTLTDIRTSISTTARQPIDLMSTSNDRYILAEKEHDLTIINFFATWCPPCHAEMPHLQRFAEDLPDEVALIGVNLTERDNGREALQAFMAKYQITYPILLDEMDQFGQGYQIISIPTTVLLDADGQELERIVGPVSEEVLRNLVKKY